MTTETNTPQVLQCTLYLQRPTKETQLHRGMEVEVEVELRLLHQNIRGGTSTTSLLSDDISSYQNKHLLC